MIDFEIINFVSNEFANIGLIVNWWQNEVLICSNYVFVADDWHRRSRF